MFKKKNNWFFVAAALLIVLDQVTKLAVKGFSLWGIEHQGMMYNEMISVIGSFLQFTFVENEGMAFGISFGAGKIFLSLFSVAAGIALGIYLNRLEKFSFWVRLGIMLIFAGAVGNLIDRVFYGVIFDEGALFYGKVVDFIQVDIPDMDFMGLRYTHWPVFNIADSCVSCGVVLLVLFHKKLPAFREVFPKRIEPEEQKGNSIPDNTVLKKTEDE